MRDSRVRSPLLMFEYSSTDATSAIYPETSVQPLPDFHGQNSGGPVPSCEPPTGPQFVDRRIIATCSCTKAANFFSARQRTAIRTERPSSDHVSYPERTQALTYPLAAWSWECPQPRVQIPANLVGFREFRVFCARRDGTPHSSLGHPSLPPVGSSNAHHSLRRSRRPPLRAVHHLSTRAAHCIPANAGATTSLPFRKVSTHSKPSTPPPPAHDDHNSSLALTLNAPHPHYLK